MRVTLFATALLVLSLPLTAFAQSIGDTSTFSISASPQYPAPYGQETLSLTSSTLDLTGAIMVVSVGGKNIYQGSVRPVAVPLGKTGSVTNVVVTITIAGEKYSQALSIQPQEVMLVAEPISSAPPLYSGKSLVPLEGGVRVVAVANLQNASGKMLDPATFAYSWTVDGAQIADVSGIGKTAMTVASPLQYRAREVSVAVTSQDGSLVGGASFTLTAEDPSVRIYENDPLLGILFDHALSGSYAIAGVEDMLYAAPFSLPTSNSLPLLQWFLNGDMEQEGNLITLRPTGSGQGSASLSVTASGGESAKADESLSLSFGATSGGFGFFGL